MNLEFLKRLLNAHPKKILSMVWHGESFPLAMKLHVCYVTNKENYFKEESLTMVSPIPRLKIPAKGASGRSLNPEHNHFGNAQPNRREKWLQF